jgi:hypothetical protein
MKRSGIMTRKIRLVVNSIMADVAEMITDSEHNKSAINDAKLENNKRLVHRQSRDAQSKNHEQLNVQLQLEDKRSIVFWIMLAEIAVTENVAITSIEHMEFAHNFCTQVAMAMKTISGHMKSAMICAAIRSISVIWHH